MFKLSKRFPFPLTTTILTYRQLIGPSTKQLCNISWLTLVNLYLSKQNREENNFITNYKCEGIVFIKKFIKKFNYVNITIQVNDYKKSYRHYLPSYFVSTC